MDAQDEERLYYSDTEYMKLSLSSSGQQEAVWILQLIFSLMLNNTRATLVIEEPEAHLFPEAQMYMVWLMALFANQEGNRLIVTTHSPYILTSLNNLLYAEQVGKVAERESVEKIIPSSYWLDFDRLSVNLIGEGEISSILDRSIKQIKAEMIDSVSGIKVQTPALRSSVETKLTKLLKKYEGDLQKASVQMQETLA